MENNLVSKAGWIGMYPQLKKIKGNDAILKDRMTVFCQNEGRKELQKHIQLPTGIF